MDSRGRHLDLQGLSSHSVPAPDATCDQACGGSDGAAIPDKTTDSPQPGQGGVTADRVGQYLIWAVSVIVPVVFVSVFFIYPVTSLIGEGFFNDARFTLAGFVEVFSSPRTWRMIKNTLLFASLGTVFSVLFGVPGAYLFYRVSFPGRRLLRTLITIPFVLPSIVVGVAFKTLFSASGMLGFLHLDGSIVAIICALVFFNYSVIVRTTGTLWARLDPRTVEAAQTLGAKRLRAFLTITLPSLTPAIASGAAVVFMFCASSYGVVMVLGGVSYGTIETEIWYQTAYMLNLPAAAALSIVQLFFVVIALWITSRMQARSAQALKLHADHAAEVAFQLRRDGLPALIAGFVVLSMVLPVLNLAVASFRTETGWGFDHYLTLLGYTHKSFSVPVSAALVNTLVTATQATLLALSLGIMVSLVLSRRPRQRKLRAGIAILDAIFMLPLGVSAVTVGFGFLISLNRPPLDLRTSIALIPIAQAMVALPLVVRVLLPTLRAINPRQREVAETLSATPVRILRTIDLPYLISGLGVAAGFAFSTSLGEFGATSFLARPDRPTLPVMIFKLISRPGTDNYGAAMAAAMVLVLLTGLVMAILDRIELKERPW